MGAIRRHSRCGHKRVIRGGVAAGAPGDISASGVAEDGSMPVSRKAASAIPISTWGPRRYVPAEVGSQGASSFVAGRPVSAAGTEKAGALYRKPTDPGSVTNPGNLTIPGKLTDKDAARVAKAAGKGGLSSGLPKATLAKTTTLPEIQLEAVRQNPIAAATARRAMQLRKQQHASSRRAGTRGETCSAEDRKALKRGRSRAAETGAEARCRHALALAGNGTSALRR